MITAIYNAISWIVDCISNIFEFVQWFITSIIETIGFGVRALGMCASYLMQFPVYWVAPMTAIVTIAIIFKIKG